MSNQTESEHTGNPMTPDDGTHAVVIGGSMAGLLAARVLADHFDRVTIIDRDRFPNGPEVRKGVPQANHLHLLLVRGHQILEQLFSGLDAELAAAGAPYFDVGNDMYGLLSHGRWAQRGRSELITRACSRALLEWAVRRRLSEVAAVRFQEKRRVTALIADGGHQRVIGVRLDARSATGDEAGQEAPLYANLVVDASGRGSRAPDWLESLGYPLPEVTVVDSFLGYASRRYKVPADFEHDWKLLFLFPALPDGRRGGAIQMEEDGHMIATLAGASRDYPPTNEDGFLEFARTLPSPLLYEVIKDAEPVTPIYGYRQTANQLRHYERLARWPDNFVVVGDAVCAFNPVYGQGMSVSAMCALALDENLRAQRKRRPDGDLTGMTGRFQKRLAKINATAWVLATGQDLLFPETEGDRPNWVERLMQRYADQVFALTATSHQINVVFWSVANFVRPPTALFQPWIALRVLGRVISLRRPKGDRVVEQGGH